MPLFLGFVYQFHHLLADFSALENVAMPLLIGGVKPSQAKKEAAALLDKVGLSHRVDHRPSELSGGERQRVAIARALVNDPQIILADEPTGALDSKSGAEIEALFNQLHAEGRTLIIVTHDNALAERTKRIITIKDGKVISDRLPVSEVA